MKKKLLVLVTIAVMCLSIFTVMLTGCKDDKPFTVSFDSDGGNGAQYIRIQKPEVKNAAEEVQYRISIVATNYDNEVIAITQGTINVQ